MGIPLLRKGTTATDAARFDQLSGNGSASSVPRVANYTVLTQNNFSAVAVNATASTTTQVSAFSAFEPVNYYSYGAGSISRNTGGFTGDGAYTLGSASGSYAGASCCGVGTNMPAAGYFGTAILRVPPAKPYALSFYSEFGCLLKSSTDQIYYKTGLVDALGKGPFAAKGCWFESQYSDTNWFFCYTADSGSTVTRINTNVPFATTASPNGYFSFQIDFDTTNGTKAYVNGNLVASVALADGTATAGTWVTEAVRTNAGSAAGAAIYNRYQEMILYRPQGRP